MKTMEDRSHSIGRQTLDREIPLSLPDSFQPTNRAKQLRRFVLATGLLMLCFAKPLADLISFAARSDLYSYILLIPFISLYLVWLKKGSFSLPSRPSHKTVVVFLAAAVVPLALYWFVLRPGLNLTQENYLALMMTSFLFFFLGIYCSFFGLKTLRAAVFPLGFLFFMVPIPTAALDGFDAFLQYSSAAVAGAFFSLSGTPFLQEGLVFQLPVITIRIATECSGIHSTLVLLITSVVAGYIFLRAPRKRALFILAVIPLGILRNGFRVFTIGQLCIHIGPQMIDSPIHHKGGPIFFILSLIPLFLLLMALRKSEQKKAVSNTQLRVIA